MASARDIAELVERFNRNLDDYRSGRYKETQLRLEFIDPFFEALGWDVHNRRGYAEAYKDVIHEDAIKVGGATKAPDYCFRIGGTRKFFVEAKKPSVSIKDAVHPAYQLRRYAWSAKLPLSILTDFEEFAAYDCRIPPSRTDKASAARTLYIPFTEYPSRWDEIASIFSREEVLKGSFDKYAESTKRRKGTAEVDSAFLREIEVWRESLARHIALRNPQLSQRELNFGVQRTIDRIIFLRICEDRGIEHYGQLRALLNGTSVYPRLCQLFYRADERYNSGLFYFRKEKARPDAPDELTPRLTVDDKVLKEIITRLYYPESPYEFSVLPADILGQVYEQFLGKVIRLTAGHRAVVEDKPEVRKAGGVYYTPTYIVDYIVRNTVGKLLEGEGSGVRDQGSGYGVSGSGKGDCTYGAEDVSRPPGLAKGDGPGRSGLHDDGGIPGPGEVRADEPDSEGGSLDSGQHRGGLRPDTPGGLSSSSLDCQRLPDGGGDVSDVGGASEIRQQGACSGGLEPDGTGGQDADQTHRLSEASPNPKPQTVNPKEASRLRILDPACGSGSFLIGAYQYLLDWHLNWYTSHNPEKWARKKTPPIYETRTPYPPNPKPHTPSPTYRLTTSERKRILLNNIYGVDIDPQAVEVTKLSLLLKVLEGENEETLERQLKFFHERALPDLGSNIKCGNSLIGPDFYDNQQIEMFDEEERYRINAFDWNAEFPDIMKAGGFDAVIGNPPYVIITPNTVVVATAPYLLRFTVAQFKADLFHLFIQRSIELLVECGRFGFIVPNPWLTQVFAERLRSYILDHTSVEEIVVFHHLVFESANVHTCLLFLKKGGARARHKVTVRNAASKADLVPDLETRPATTAQAFWARTPGHPFETRLVGEVGRLVAKVATQHRALAQVARASLGCQAYNRTKHTPEEIAGRVFHADRRLGEEYLPELAGRDVGRYELNRVRGRWIRYGPWLHDYRTLDWLQGPRILVREIPGRTPYNILACYVEETYCNYKTILNVNPSDSTSFSMKYLLGLINSKLLSFLYPLTSNKIVARSFPRLSVGDLKRLPIRVPDLVTPAERLRHDRMVELVERMLELHKKLPAAKTAHEKTVLQREIETTDRQIDQLVYELYGLTEEEIKIVEEATR